MLRAREGCRAGSRARLALEKRQHGCTHSKIAFVWITLARSSATDRESGPIRKAPSTASNGARANASKPTEKRRNPSPTAKRSNLNATRIQNAFNLDPFRVGSPGHSFHGFRFAPPRAIHIRRLRRRCLSEFPDAVARDRMLPHRTRLGGLISSSPRKGRQIETYRSRALHHSVLGENDELKRIGRRLCTIQSSKRTTD